jgi:hypothetical protein
MKMAFISQAIVAAGIILSSCTVTIYSTKTYPPEMDLPLPQTTMVFGNFFDYTAPGYIKDKQEVTYASAVRGFISGLDSVFSDDPAVKLITGDTLARNYTVLSMQDTSFRDTVRTVCSRFDADMLMALDSMDIWFDWETINNEDEDLLKINKFYLFSDYYLTLYTSDGEVIDRSQVQKGMVYSTRPALIGAIAISPSLARAATKTGDLAQAAGEEYAGKFYPSDERLRYMLYSGRPFIRSNDYIINGDPVMALEPLRVLTGSPKKKIANKAAHNLSVVYEIMENRRNTDEINKNFRR